VAEQSTPSSEPRRDGAHELTDGAEMNTVVPRAQDGRVPQRWAWASDIHLNFVSGRRRLAFCRSVCRVADGLIVTGDIGESTDLERHLRALAHAIPVVAYVLGNHDLYDSDAASVHALAERLTDEIPNLWWLDASGILELSSTTALIGVGGWADARWGRWEVAADMNDYRYIADFRVLGEDQRMWREVMERWANRDAQLAEQLLTAAASRYSRVVMATHVPPFWESAQNYRGRPMSTVLYPHYCSRIMGQAIVRVMQQYPDTRLGVLCGHTHGATEHSPLPNVTVYTAYAEYGDPRIQPQVVDVASPRLLEPSRRESHVPPGPRQVQTIDRDYTFDELGWE